MALSDSSPQRNPWQPCGFVHTDELSQYFCAPYAMSGTNWLEFIEAIYTALAYWKAAAWPALG